MRKFNLFVLIFLISLGLAQGASAGGRIIEKDSSAKGNLIVDPSKGSHVEKLGLITHDPSKAYQGYTLFAPKHYLTTYLMDMNGGIINTWWSKYEPGQSVYLLENGNLMHLCHTTPHGDFIGGGEGGRVEEYNWEGDMVWSMWFSDETKLMHHDYEPLPNGNFLAMVVEKKTHQQCIDAGMPAQLFQNARSRFMYPEYIVEIERFGSQGFEVKWEWHIWDHLVQDFDSTKDNYGVVAEHPELLSVYQEGTRFRVGFWNHGNSIDYNAKFDQICLDARGQNEFWILDHSTTTKEAKGHTGGRYGKGGDILYRWGNPMMYDAGTAEDQMLWLQHDPQWVQDHLPGAGNMIIFNNGRGRGFSSVDEIVIPQRKDGSFPELKPGEPHKPKELYWTFVTDPPKKMYSTEISGAQRMPNGNTLVCAGTYGRFMEVTPYKEIVWEYKCPVDGNGPMEQGESIVQDSRGHEMNAVFKINRFSPDYAAFKGRDMTPKLKTLVGVKY